ncbi:MAG: hypothetical protein MIN69_19930 [Methylorubrum extorquens]|jgi:hypothetical protein|uniref:hypothetical protein n=1 Tax=Methylorubrum extorquens TaxID=408 RepID=UPI002FEE23FE
MTVDSMKSPAVADGFARRHPYGSWVEGHGDAALSSNVGSADLAFQRWFRFKEAYSPRLVAEILDGAGLPARRVIDPTGGSGTTALTCSFLGIDCDTVEVNPFLADVIEAKTRSYVTSELSEDMALVLGSPSTAVDISRLAAAPRTLIEPGVDGRWVFGSEVAARIMSLHDAIERHSRPQHRPLLKVLLGSILRDVSNVTVNGKGRKYRSGWERRTIRAADVNDKLREACKVAIHDIVRFGARTRGTVRVHRGDARTTIQTLPRADCAIFSPPYPNSFDYTDIYNLELWMLGYLSSPADNKALRLATMHSHVQLNRPARVPTFPSISLARTMEGMEGVRDRLWHRDIPAMLSSYFADLETMVLSLQERIDPGGAIAVVIGGSSYAGVEVDAPGILAELAASAGLPTVTRRKLRDMRLSAQQGGRHGLAEELVVLRA